MESFYLGWLQGFGNSDLITTDFDNRGNQNGKLRRYMYIIYMDVCVFIIYICSQLPATKYLLQLPMWSAAPKMAVNDPIPLLISHSMLELVLITSSIQQKRLHISSKLKLWGGITPLGFGSSLPTHWLLGSQLPCHGTSSVERPLWWEMKISCQQPFK